MSQRRVQVDIRGTSRGNCSQTVTDALASLAGSPRRTSTTPPTRGRSRTDPEAVSPGEIYDAIEAADVPLVRDDPLDAVKAIRVGEGTLARIEQSPVRALGHNTATSRWPRSARSSRCSRPAPRRSPRRRS